MIQTFSGNVFKFDDPVDINIKDIAHSLALVNRFGGHTRVPFSVADHSLLVSDRCSNKNKLWGLMHDSSEAYIGDIVRPFKRRREWYPFLKKLEDSILKAIAKEFGLGWPIPEEIKQIDERMYMTEQRDLMPGQLYKLVAKPYDFTIVPLDWEAAECLFFEHFYRLQS